MKLFGKILLGTGITTALIGGYNYFKNLNRANTELETIPNASIHSVSLNGLKVRIDVTMKNPTKGSFSIQFPFMKLIYNDTTIGSSQVVNKLIELPPFGEAIIDSIMVDVPISSIATAGYGMIKEIIAGNGIQVTIKTITTINLGWKTLPYEKVDLLTLKKDPIKK
jgi:hypothetical protein